MVRSNHSGMLGRASRACMAFAVAACMVAGPAAPAFAEEYPDILLASFFNSETDQSDTLYTSVDGQNFQSIGVAYQDATPNDSSAAWIPNTPYNVSTLHDPSIIYHDGWFYMLSGFTDHASCPGKFIPMIGYSKDLVNWAYPNSGSATNVGLSQNPPTSNSGNFDIVAPEFFQTSSGDVYITFSAGYYGANHGQPQNDQMYPYIVKLDHLAPGTQAPESNPGAAPNVSYGTAVPINLPEGSSNRIDGSFFEENGTYYYIIKNNGITNEIWSINDMSRVSNPSAWTKVNGNALTGFEGPSLVKFQGQYWLYTDKLADYPAGASDGTTGVFVQRSGSLASGWWGNDRISTKNLDGRDIANRHGTVIAITDPAAKEVVWKARERAGYVYEAGKNGVEVRDVNGVTEHYFWENGVMAQSKEAFVDGAWRWYDSDGTMAFSKDAYLPSSGGKWVRYNERGEMIKGEDYRYGGWYYFDPTTGAMAKGWRTLPDGRQVYYDQVTGQMLHGWHNVDGQNIYFDEVTGARR
ncbi:hypothetical protein [Collinsella tanakaei]|uniref:hypothetical protein n=1 Tax=Collinsella tanakaei TaxID=626935 RepID=UPI001955FFFA|nr:hypothetical protein [Collinsella tanakaei]MBM6868705.1 hypothetical protein [Collinsella tanakaei]